MNNGSTYKDALEAAEKVASSMIRGGISTLSSNAPTPAGVEPDRGDVDLSGMNQGE